MENKEVTKTNYNLDLDKSETQAVLINTVAKGASKAEFMMFLEMCKTSGLNPFKKEIWFIKTYTGVQMMTGLNGFYEIANSNPMYDGIEVIESEVKLEILVDGKKKEVPEYMEARVWRKDRKFPDVARAKWVEFAKPLISEKGKVTIWGTIPSIMLSKCAESMALRKAFPQKLNGLYTEEEYIESNSIPVQSANSKSSPINQLLENKTIDREDGTSLILEPQEPVIEDFSQYASESFLTGEK